MSFEGLRLAFNDVILRVEVGGGPARPAGAARTHGRTDGRTHGRRASVRPPSNTHRKKIRRSGQAPPHSVKKIFTSSYIPTLSYM